MAFTPPTKEERRKNLAGAVGVGLGGLTVLGGLHAAGADARAQNEQAFRDMFGGNFGAAGAGPQRPRRPSNVDEGGGTMEEKMAYRAKRDTGPEGDIARRKLEQIKRAKAEAEGKAFRARVKKGFSGFVSKVAGIFKKKPIAKVAMLMSAREELQSIIALDATGNDYAMAGITGYGGLKAIHASTPRLLGKQRFYHGTSKQNAEKIIKEGLDPEMGGKSGASAHVGSSSFVENSTGHVHVTPSKRVAAAFSHLHGSEAAKGDPKQALSMLKGFVLGTAGPGAIVEGHLDYDRFKRDFHPDPDMGGGQAFRTKTKIGTESIGSSVTKGVSAGSIAKYIKANPGRFAAGAGLAAAGGAGLAYGANRLLGKKPVRNMSAADELDSIIQLAAWTRKEGKSRSGGLNEKGRKSYERENPGSDLKAPSKEAGNPRRASFCARMSGMKKKLTSSKTANDPDSRINKSLKAWNCSAREDLNTILFKKKGGDYKRHWSQKKTDKKGKKKCADCGETSCECHTYSAREELEVIQLGIGSWLTGAGKRIGGVAGDLAMPDALGSLGGQLVQGAKFATMGGARGITSGLKVGAEDAGSAMKNLWGKLKPAKSAYASGMNPFQNSMVHASARDQLSTILMGREELEVIRFGLLDKLKNIIKKPKSQIASPEALKKAGIQVFEPQKMNVEKFTPKRFGELSAREELEVIQFGGEFGYEGMRIDETKGKNPNFKPKPIPKLDAITEAISGGKKLKFPTSPAAKAALRKALGLSARDQLNTILLAAGDWRERTSDNAGAIAAASGAVGGLSSYVRGGVENAANWKNAGRIKGSLAGGAVAGLGGYAIAKLLKKDKPGQAQIARRIGSGHQNSLSARDQLNTIQFGLLSSGFAINAMSGGGLLSGLKSAFTGGLAKQASGSGLDSLARKGLQNAGKGGSYMLPWNTNGIKVRSSVFPANRFHGQLRREWSARDQLSTILMGVDVRPRDPMGRFDQAEDGAPNSQHMKIVYAAPQEQAPPAITGKNMGKLAAGGAAFMGGGMALQHLIEKLKKLKK